LWFPSSSFHNKLANWVSNRLRAHLGNWKKDNRYIGILDRHAWIKILLAAKESNLALHPVILHRILSMRGCRFSLLSLSKCSGIPKYLTGKDPSLHWKFSMNGRSSYDSMLIGINSLLWKLIPIPEICLKQVKIHFKFKATCGSFSKNSNVSSAYCRLTTPPGINLGAKSFN
jgi:hypothetical protein